jgi:hypothetical protein
MIWFWNGSLTRPQMVYLNSWLGLNQWQSNFFLFVSFTNTDIFISIYKVNFFFGSSKLIHILRTSTWWCCLRCFTVQRCHYLVRRPLKPWSCFHFWMLCPPPISSTLSSSLGQNASSRDPCEACLRFIFFSNTFLYFIFSIWFNLYIFLHFIF